MFVATCQFHWININHILQFLSYILSLSFPFVYRLNMEGKSEVFASGFCLDDECWRVYEQKVHNVLIEGLSDRVKLVRVIWRNTPSECIIENVWG